MSAGGPAAAQAFPGATGVTLLDVYDWPTPDGLRGGSAHIHLASTEGYLVLRGAGRLQTLGGQGFQETPLLAGDCLWFTPGTVHRLVNDDGQLQILVIMQNAGLPEAGDCVLTFPPEVLADPDRYASAAALGDTALGDAALGSEALEAAARGRRDLAIEGFLVLREQVIRNGPAALDGFLAAAVRLTARRVPDWRDRWRTEAAAVTALTGTHLDGVGVLNPAHLRAGTLLRAERDAGPRRYGMCGRRHRLPPARRAVAGRLRELGGGLGAGCGSGGPCGGFWALGPGELGVGSTPVPGRACPLFTRGRGVRR